MRRVVFLGTPEFALPSLQALYNSPGLDLMMIISQPDRPAGRGQKLQPTPTKVFAQKHSILLHQPAKISEDLELITKLREMKPDLLITAAFGQILSKEILEVSTQGVWNVHASLLPRWRGAAPIQWAILSGDKETGITIMLTEEDLDSGDILHKVICPIESSDTTTTLTSKLSKLGADALMQALNPSYIISPKKQPLSEITLAPKIKKNMREIDWSSVSASEVERKLKALNPYPGVIMRLSPESAIKIINAHSKQPKQINDPTSHGQMNEKLEIACKKGILKLEEVQPPGKQVLRAEDWAKGIRQIYPIKLYSKIDHLG